LALTGIGVSAPLLLLISAFSALVAGGAASLAAMDLGRGQAKESEYVRHEPVLTADGSPDVFCRNRSGKNITLYPDV